jgi:hypothetical protein
MSTLTLGHPVARCIDCEAIGFQQFFIDLGHDELRCRDCDRKISAA